MHYITNYQERQRIQINTTNWGQITETNKRHPIKDTIKEHIKVNEIEGTILSHFCYEFGDEDKKTDRVENSRNTKKKLRYLWSRG